jgi:hypothetical protein
MTKKTPLQVTLHVEEPSVVALTLGDTVQLDRLTETPEGVDAERHGPLLGPGVRTVALEPGNYAFRTLCDADLRVVTGGVASEAESGSKDDWPDPPKKLFSKGDSSDGELPRFTVR